MGYKKLTCCLLLSMGSVVLKAQTIDYQTVDSISTQKYLSRNWKELISYGKQAIASGNDFLDLRLRLGYANFQLGNFSAALAHYQKALQDDSRNETALTYSYLANTYLHQNEQAGYLTAKQDSVNRKVKPFALIDAGFEGGFKLTNTSTRGNSTYGRIFLSNRLGYRISLNQSISNFRQDLVSSTVNQFEYYAKLSYVPVKNFTLKGAFHYLNAKDLTSTYHNGLGFLALSYQLPYVVPQLDFSFGKVNAISTKQYNLTLTYYPLGNLNLYGMSRLSQKDVGGEDNFIFGQILGAKALKSLWIEGLITVGKLDHFAEADNLYIYNSIDPSTFKAGVTGYYLINQNLKISLNYTYEEKTESTFNIKYNQNSLNTGLTWKF